jgi:hypothetical protein
VICYQVTDLLLVQTEVVLGVVACTLTREGKVAGSSNVMGLTGTTSFNVFNVFGSVHLCKVQ